MRLLFFFRAAAAAARAASSGASQDCCAYIACESPGLAASLKPCPSQPPSPDDDDKEDEEEWKPDPQAGQARGEERKGAL